MNKYLLEINSFNIKEISRGGYSINFTEIEEAVDDEDILAYAKTLTKDPHENWGYGKRVLKIYKIEKELDLNEKN